jgi:peptidoglycan/xylan/chitin deacetylase (PgdA/CDA1 family)
MGDDFTWPNQNQGAVSLTYDDGLPVHYTEASPLLRQHSLLATFYPMIQSDLRLHPENWRQLAVSGHELGNHTIFHPCRQASPDPYPWLDDRYDLTKYTPAHLRAELEVANLVLYLLDGQTERTYAYTCCDATIGNGAMEQSLEPLLADLFLAARGTLTNQVFQPAQGNDLLNIGCTSADGRSLEDLTRLVEHTRASRGWSILMIHGIGAGTHDLYLDADVHERFIGWLAQQQDIWTAPVRTIAHFIKQNNFHSNFSKGRPT